MNYYVAFKACEDFYAKNGRWPSADVDVKHAMEEVVPSLSQDVNSISDGNELLKKAVREM